MEYSCMTIPAMPTHQCIWPASHDDEFIIPMQAEGTIIFFEERKLTNYELANCPHIILLLSHSQWNPWECSFHFRHHHVDEGYPLKLVVWCKASTYLVPIAKQILDWHISEVSVLVGDQTPDVPIPRTFLSDKRHSGDLAEGLSETRWYIGLLQAHDTIKVKMQNCTRSAVLPFSRW